MDLSFTPLQEELRRQARAFLEATPEPTWAQLAELGWTGAGVAEEEGGAGLSFLEEAVLHEEAGRALLHAPFWSTSSLLPFLPSEDRSAVAAGEASWTLVLGPLVPDLDTATSVAIVGGDTIWELDGAEREVLATNDESRPLGVVSGGTPGRELCPSDVLPALRARSLTMLALEAVGVAACALELSVGFVADREQFGRRIGTYQAVSHPLASSHADVELARSLAWWAAWCVAHDEEDAPIASAVAKADAADAAVLACERAIQAHGGIGFTWEHVLHRLYKRALGIQSWEASPAQLRAEVASHLLDRGGS
jgi:alkylation response protein AidB-like acyl-CoA dehydrogenase